MGMSPDDTFDITTPAKSVPMMKAMISFENGARWQRYADLQFEVALKLSPPA
jgi:hypothetical protein